MGQIKKRIAKPDLLLIGGLLLIGLASLSAVHIWTGRSGTLVQITVNGEAYGSYALAQAQTVPIEVNGAITNTLQIRNGKAKMAQADCPDKLCIHQKAVSRQGETIVCLPNQIVVEVHGDEPPEFDAIAR